MNYYPVESGTGFCVLYEEMDQCEFEDYYWWLNNGQTRSTYSVLPLLSTLLTYWAILRVKLTVLAYHIATALFAQMSHELKNAHRLNAWLLDNRIFHFLGQLSIALLIS